VRFYQQIAYAKWKVVCEIEKELSISPFTDEWNIYRNEKRFFTFGPSNLEQVIPGSIFITTFLYSLYWLVEYGIRFWQTVTTGQS
jgi:hypothetical protein